MDVYDTQNGNIWGKGKSKDKLAKLPVNYTFSWGANELFIPAFYYNDSTVVMDVCTCFSISDMQAFLQKWNRKRRLSLKTHEDYEEMEADNPACKDFSADLCLDGQPLRSRAFGSILWYPVEFLQAEAQKAEEAVETWCNDEDAEKLMAAYGCDRTLCWHFERLSFRRKQPPTCTPRQLSLVLHAREISVTTGYFTTDATQTFPTEIKTAHPATGQEYVLTLYGCEQFWQSFDEIGEKDMCYPEHAQTLSYGVSPEIEKNVLYVCDQSQGDSPRKKEPGEPGNGGESPSRTSAGADGPTAVFQTGKSPVPGRHMACSALHFTPVKEVRWRITFHVKTMGDMELCISL